MTTFRLDQLEIDAIALGARIAALSVPVRVDDNTVISARRLRLIWKSVAVTEECWLSDYAPRNGVHVAVKDSDATIYCHRAIYAFAYGPIAAEKKVCHHCDVGNCLRPDHLFLGSQIDNVLDMHAKGRAIAPPVHRGERHHNATLTDVEVSELRALAGVQSQRRIAELFGVSQSTVWRLLHQEVRP